jgi:putative pyruvate formate lyase activating enzyme
MKYPSYLNLSQKEWQKRIKIAWARLNPCRICARGCGANRQDRNDPSLGFCQAKDRAKVYSYHPHHGEENVLRGWRGSGTIFFSSCNLACVYCQNWEISQLRLGKEAEPEELAKMMINLQNLGCHNINFVSPSPYVPQILKAMPHVVKAGLKIPLVYNTGGYDHVETLKILDGIVDIYMPDIKYSDSKIALKYSQVPNYWEKCTLAIKEMHRQVGGLEIDPKTSLAVRGLLIRHLILPHEIAGTKKVMQFIAKEISKDSFVNIMDQYSPENKAFSYPELSRPITSEEFQKAIETAKKFGLWRFAD